MPVKSAILHQATMLFGINISEKTLNHTKMPGALFSWCDQGLKISCKDKQSGKIKTNLIPHASVAVYLMDEDEEQSVAKKK